MSKQHDILPEGESTEKWAFREDGFMGSVKQLLNCARCGEFLYTNHHNEPRHAYDVLKPSMHFLCESCYDDLPA